MTMPLWTPDVQSTANTLLGHIINSKSMHSPRIERLISLLEGTPGLDIRQVVDIITSTYLPAPDPVEYNRCASFREQIAYLASLDFSHAPLDSVSLSSNLHSGQIAQSIWKVINFMETTILPRIAPDESRILRSSVLANLPIALTHEERWFVASTISAMRKVCEDNGMCEFAQTMHFEHLTDAQRIAKIQEWARILQHYHLYDELAEADRAVITTLNVNEKLRPLQEMDRAYRHVGDAYNSVRHSYRHFGANAGPLSPQECLSVETIVAALGKDIQGYLKSNPESTGGGGFMSVDNILRELRWDARLAEECAKNAVTVSGFSRLFSRYVTLERLRIAKGQLEEIKDRLLGQHRKFYELSVESWKNHARERIVTVVRNARTTGAGRVVFSDSEIDEFSSYLERWSSVFASSDNDPINQDLQAALVAVLDRSPALQANAGLRARAVEYIQGQGSAVENLVHNKRNIFESRDWLGAKFLHTVAQTERARKAVVKHTAPVLKGVSRFLETATKQVLGATTNATVATGRWVGNAGNAIANTTRPEIKNKNFLLKNLERAVKYPFHWVTGVPSKIVGNVFGKFPAEVVDWTGNRVKAVHDGTIKATQAGFGDSNLTDMTAIASRLLDLGFGAVGGTVSFAGKKSYDALNTHQQAQVFDSILSGVHDEEQVRSALDTLGLAAAFNGDLGLGLNDHLGTTPYVGSLRSAPDTLKGDEKIKKDAYDAVVKGLEYWMTELKNRKDNLPTGSERQVKAYDLVNTLIKDISSAMKKDLSKPAVCSTISALLKAVDIRLATYETNARIHRDSIDDQITGANGLQAQVKDALVNMWPLRWKAHEQQTSAYEKLRDQLIIMQDKLQDADDALALLHAVNQNVSGSLRYVLHTDILATHSAIFPANWATPPTWSALTTLTNQLNTQVASLSI